jgi:hypothetical protein
VICLTCGQTVGKWENWGSVDQRGGNVDSDQLTAIEQTPAGVLAGHRTRTARWVPWALFLVELVVTSIVVGILSIALVVQLTLTPGAIFGEFDDIFTWVVSLGVDVAVEIIGAVFVFLLTGLIVGIVGLPIRLIGPVRRAWLGNGEVTVAGVIIGTLLIVVAYALGSWGNIHQDHGTYAFFTPSPLPLLIGWFVLALSLSLLVWPARWLPRRARAWWTETQLTKRSRFGQVQDNLTLR